MSDEFERWLMKQGEEKTCLAEAFTAGREAERDKIKKLWPSEDEEIEVLAHRLVGIDRDLAKYMGLGWKMYSDWLRERLGLE